MTYVFEFPDELYESSMIIYDIEEVARHIKFHGKAHESLITCQSEWNIAPFGTFTIDVKSLTLGEKIGMLIKALEFAKKKDKHVIYLFNVYKGIFTIFFKYQDNF